MSQGFGFWKDPEATFRNTVWELGRDCLEQKVGSSSATQHLLYRLFPAELPCGYCWWPEEAVDL
jgi:hypothetical protein